MAVSALRLSRGPLPLPPPSGFMRVFHSGGAKAALAKRALFSLESGDSALRPPPMSASDKQGHPSDAEINKWAQGYLFFPQRLRELPLIAIASFMQPLMEKLAFEARTYDFIVEALQLVVESVAALLGRRLPVARV